MHPARFLDTDNIGTISQSLFQDPRGIEQASTFFWWGKICINRSQLFRLGWLTSLYSFSALWHGPFLSSWDSPYSIRIRIIALTKIQTFLLLSWIKASIILLKPQLSMCQLMVGLSIIVTTLNPTNSFPHLISLDYYSDPLSQTHWSLKNIKPNKCVASSFIA